MASSVLLQPDYQVTYDNSLLNTMPGVFVTNTINAYMDSNLFEQNLTLGASSNVVLEAWRGIDAVIDPYERIRFRNFDSAMPQNDPRSFLHIEYNPTVDISTVYAPVNSLQVTGGDANQTTYISSSLMKIDGTAQELSTDQNYFWVKNDTTFASNVNIDSNLTVTGVFTNDGDAFFSSNLEVTGSLIALSNFEVAGTTSFLSDLQMNGNATISSNLTVTGYILGQSNLTIAGSIIGQSNLEITDDAVLNSQLHVVGKTLLSSNLEVTETILGQSNMMIVGPTSLQSTLDVGDAATVGSTLDVTGATTLSSTLSVTDATTLSSSLYVAAATTLDSTLNVTSAATLYSTLDVTSAITGTSTLTISGDATLHSNLEVDIDILGKRNLAVSGNMFSSTLNLYKNLNPASNENSTSQIAYGMFINGADQLEIIKFEKNVDLQSSNVTTTQRRVAIWGTDKNYDSNSIANYNVLNEYNGITTDSVISSNAIGFTYGYTNNIPGTGGGGADATELLALSNYVITSIKKSSSNVYIDSTSNLCVGTFQPNSNARLTVNGAIAATSYCNLILDNVNWTNATKYVPSLSNFNWLRSVALDASNQAYSGTSGGMGAFEVGSNANSLMIMGSNVGIGLSNPATKLHVAGVTTTQNVAFSNSTGSLYLGHSNSKLGVGNSNPTYTLHVTGNIAATQDIVAFSDSNFKTNLSPITSAVSKVTQIGGYTFNKTDPSDTRRYAGVLAQEIQNVLPEVVYNEDNKLSVAYGNLTALLIEAVKELNTRLTALEAH